MKNFKLFSFFSLALVTLVGAGCSASPATDVNTNTSSNTESDAQTTAQTDNQTAPSTNTNTTPTTDSAGAYADGTYSATGTYTSPGGKESLPVTLTLEGGVIVDASVETPATNPLSQKFQVIFADNFKAMVVGKSIDDVNLTKVSGSSLTPAGFNDAVAQIKAEAQI